MPSNTKLLFFLFLSTLVLVAWLYFPAFTSYFFQDDWFSFSISRAKNFTEFFNLFSPRNDVIYYRPLGMQIPFFLVQKLLGYDPEPFRIATLFFHLVNGWLVFACLFIFVRNKFLSYVGSFLYLTSATHFIIFFWAATFAFVLAPSFYFASFFSFIKRKYRVSLLFFIVGLFVNELLVTLPLIVTIFFFIHRYKSKIILMPFWMVSLIYVLFRFVFARFPTTGGYTFLTSFHQVLLNIRNYSLWSFNWPDEINGQFVSFFTLNLLFIKEFWPYIALFMITTVLYAGLFIIVPTMYLVSKKNVDSQMKNQLVFGLLWFFITLSPVLFFSKHNFSYYLPIPLFGILLLGSTLLNRFWTNKRQSVIFICFVVGVSWYVSSWKNIRLNLLIHWAPQRAKRAEVLIEKLKNKYPVLPQNAVVIIDQNEENKWALGDQHGLQVIYNDQTISTFYGSKDDINTDPLSERPIIEFK